MKKRTIVFVRSQVTGRVALVNPTSVLMGTDKVPVVENLNKDVEFRPVEFDGSDQIIEGVRRTFWVVDIPREDFRRLLAHKKSVEWVGSFSVDRHQKEGPLKELLTKAFLHLPKLSAVKQSKENAA